MLKNASVSDFIRQHTEAALENAVMDADRVIAELAKIALHGERESNRIKALELLGKRYALFTDKVEHGGKPEVHIKWGAR